MIRKILVPVRGDGNGENVLAHAVLMARRYGAHIDVVHCRPRPEDLLPKGVPLPKFLRAQFAGQADTLADEEEGKLRRDFDRIMGDLTRRMGDAPDGEQPTAVWIEDRGKQVDVIRRRGRLADLIVVSKPDRDTSLGTNSLMAGIFHTGRPVLMCPPRAEPPRALGATVTLAWNGSLEATRAVSGTLDILLNAESVTVLTIEARNAHGAKAEDLQEYLAVRGIEARYENLPADGGIAQALLHRSDAIGADLMIMGAYSESHEKEAIFGGNTQLFVDQAGVPIIFVH